jgi:hypothetical protein
MEASDTTRFRFRFRARIQLQWQWQMTAAATATVPAAVVTVDLYHRMLSGWVGGNPKSEIQNGRAGGIPNS